jgi:hypothetical protein
MLVTKLGNFIYLFCTSFSASLLTFLIKKLHLLIIRIRSAFTLGCILLSLSIYKRYKHVYNNLRANSSKLNKPLVISRINTW